METNASCGVEFDAEVSFMKRELHFLCLILLVSISIPMRKYSVCT